MIKVAIADDHPLILSGIQTIMSQLPQFEVVGLWNSGSDARNGIEHSCPDILLLDISLPDIDGITLCKEFTKKYPDLKIIALTSYNQNIMARNMLKSGASGYLLKNTSAKEIHSAMLQVLSGEVYIQEEVKESILRESIGKAVRTDISEVKLTRREKEILRLITEGSTTAEISEKLFISIKTVETHRTHLMEKTGMKNVASLVRFAIEQGMV